MPTYTVAPLTGVPPDVVGLISLDPSTETGTGDGLFADGTTDRVFIPGGLVIYAIQFDLAVAGSPVGVAESGVRMQLPPDPVSFIHAISYVSAPSSFSHVVADDGNLSLGSFPYRVPLDGVFLWVEFDANFPGNVVSGLVTIGYSRTRGWTLGSAGWS